MLWFDQNSAPAGVPIVDLEGLAHDAAPASEAFQSIADEIGRTVAAGSGMFYVRGHGISPSVIADVVRVTGEFFSGPREIRQRMICPTLPLRGFSDLASESAAKVFGAGEHPDMCMKYTWTADNVYPDTKFRDVWQDYQDAAGRTCQLLLRLIRHALGETARNDELWRQIIDGEAMIRHLYYPDVPLDDDAQAPHAERMAAHNDIGAITLLHQTPCPNGFVSLQAEVEGRFVGIPAIRDTMVVNLGDVLVHLTDGRVKAARHRVLQSPHRGGERTATLCFYFPNGRFDLKALDGSTFQGLLDKEKFRQFAEFLTHLSGLYCGKHLN